MDCQPRISELGVLRDRRVPEKVQGSGSSASVPPLREDKTCAVSTRMNFDIRTTSSCVEVHAPHQFWKRGVTNAQLDTETNNSCTELLAIRQDVKSGFQI